MQACQRAVGAVGDALAVEKTSFATVLDDVRRHAARRYLTGTDIPVTEVAGLLGFSGQGTGAQLPTLLVSDSDERSEQQRARIGAERGPARWALLAGLDAEVNFVNGLPN